MSNKRQLKKIISEVCTSLAAECIAISTCENAMLNEDGASLLQAVLFTHDDFIRRVSHPEPGMPAKKYFDELLAQFNGNVAEYVEQINNIGGE